MARQMVPTVEQKISLFRDSLYYEIIHTFGIPAELTDEQLGRHAIGETINFSRLVHGRLLSHFLYRRSSDDDVPRKKDDAFADDFEFDIARLGLSDAERKQETEHVDLNKGLIHLTYGRVTGTTTKPWRTSFLKDLLLVTIQFMKHVLNPNLLASGEKLFANDQQREDWETLLACLERCQKGERLRFTSGFNESRTWYKPSTDTGYVEALYGALAEPTPPGAAIVHSLTNTTATVMVV